MGMITLTFNGAVNVDIIDIYQDIFKEERLNPNGCQAKGTFFVSHKYTNYSAVQELHRKGHEIGVFSITNNEDFEMMADQFFVYDASIAAPLSRVPIWPYTLEYRMPHKCHGNGGNCPSRGHPVWELPINELDRRDDPDFDENLTGCHLVSSCSNIYHKDQFRQLLNHNFERHYGTNRAP